MRLVLLCLLLTACGMGKNEDQATKQSLEQVLERKALYESLYDGIAGDAGFIDDTDCDALLFNGLYVAGSVFRDLTPFRNEETGQWFRTPGQDCYKEGRSGSTISRDMLAGLMWALWAHGQSGDLKRLQEYGRDKDWIMGSGSKDRTYFTPNFQDTLYRLLGETYKGPPYVWIDPVKDHQRHVVALNIILRGEKTGSINNDMLRILKKLKKLNPNNALYAYGVSRFTDGNQSRAIEILLNEAWFPADRLPASADRCGRWLWERDDKHENWRACQDGKIHSGGDFVFIAYLLERSQGKSLAIRSD